MTILTIRTDRPEAELGIYKDSKKAQHISWQAHRELSLTLLTKIDEILNMSSISREQLEGIVVFKGPGSFTGLRIGMAVANALAYSLGIPIVAAAGANWIEAGLKHLQDGENDKIALPEYGGPAHTTAQKK
jgi:tRNA threonylcarbamoyladenosine biosynthesis protein TsaB